jgi:hypothetical protein
LLCLYPIMSLKIEDKKFVVPISQLIVFDMQPRHEVYLLHDSIYHMCKAFRVKLVLRLGVYLS